jgi:hypothetical protein
MIKIFMAIKFWKTPKKGLITTKEGVHIEVTQEWFTWRTTSVRVRNDYCLKKMENNIFFVY